MVVNHYILTPADVADLRASVSGPTRAMGGFVRLPVPHIIYVPADDRFALLRDGHLLASHRHIEVLGALLRTERQEPGFIARVLSPAEDPERALDAAPDRSARQQSAEAARQGAADALCAADAAAWERRRLSLLNPAAITLDDL